MFIMPIALRKLKLQNEIVLQDLAGKVKDSLYPNVPTAGE